MGYCKEFMDWTGVQIEPSFEIKYVSHNMKMGEYKDIECEGLNFIGMYKSISRNALMLKMRSSNEQGFVWRLFVDVKNIYVPHDNLTMEIE